MVALRFAAGARVMIAPPPDSDAALVARAAQHDEEALRELWDRHAGAVLGYLRTLSGEDIVAEDLLQETFTAVWRGAGAYRGDAAVRTWMLAIARRRARDRRRAPVLETVAEDDMRGVADDTSTEDAALARAELAEVVTAIRRLRVAHQEVLALAYSHELTHREIALVLGIAVGTVKSRLHAARLALVEALRD